MKTEHQPVAARPAALGSSGKPQKGVPEKLDLHLDLDAHETHVHKIPKDLIQRMRERAAEERAAAAAPAPAPADDEDDYEDEPMSGVQDDRTAVFRPPPELLARAKRMRPPSKPNPISEAPTKPPPAPAAEDLAAAEFSLPPHAAMKASSPSVSQKPLAPMTPVVPAPTSKSYAPKTPAAPFFPAKLAPMTPMAPASVKPLAKTPAQPFSAHQAPLPHAPAPVAVPKPGFLAPALAAVAKDPVPPASERKGAPVSVGRVVPVAAVGVGTPAPAARESSPGALVEPFAAAGRDTLVDESSLPRDYQAPSSSRHDRPSVPRQFDAPSSTRLRDVPSTPRNERPSAHGDERPSTPRNERPSAPHGDRITSNGDFLSAPSNELRSAPRQEMSSSPRVSGEMSLTDPETEERSPLARNVVIFLAALGVAALLVWLRTH